MAEDLSAAAHRVIARHAQDTLYCKACGDRVVSHLPNGKCKYDLCGCPGLDQTEADEVLLAKAYLETAGAD